MTKLTKILMPLVLLLGGSNSLAAKIKVYLKVKHGEGCYQIDGPKTSLKIKLRKNFFFKYTISLFTDSENNIYREEGEEYNVPEGERDILGALREKAESPYQGDRIDTFNILVNKEFRKVIIKDLKSHNPGRTIEVWPAEDKELGKGIERIRFYLLGDKNNKGHFSSIPYKIEVKHRRRKRPVTLHSKRIEYTKDGK